MQSGITQVGFGRIFFFWVPLAATWLMMSAEGPFLAAIIARLDDPRSNLAAFGVAFAVAILIEAPVIMILSASTALVDDAGSLRRLRLFTYGLSGAVTLAMAALLLTSAWTTIATEWIGLSPAVAKLSHVCLAIMLPWPGAIGYRRFYQGLLIRGNRTRRVAYGTVIRLSTMAATATSLYLTTRLPGACVGAAALSAGVCLEALASRVMARQIVRDLLQSSPSAETTLSYRRIVHFYWPLALTSLIGLAAPPVVTFFMGRAHYPLESLAVLPVVNALTFVFRSVGLSFQETAIAFFAESPASAGRIIRFAAVLGLASSFVLGLVGFTPLAEFWYGGVSGLDPELTRFAIAPTRILVVLPLLSVMLSLQRAILVHGRRTGAITWATLIEIGGIVSFLAWAIFGTAMVGVTAAALAYLCGRLGANLILIPPCRRVFREG